MKLVILESPFAGDTEANIAYARLCIRDCLTRGEAPIASHLLYTQPTILDDNEPAERKIGLEAGHAWYEAADICAVYTDRGISEGMKAGIREAKDFFVKVEYRTLELKDRTLEPKNDK